ncbi:hypothetical protein YSY34_18130 [Brevibacillus brevis]
MQRNIDSSRRLFHRNKLKEIHNDMMTGEEFANLQILMAQSFLSGGGTYEKQTEVAHLSDNMFHAANIVLTKNEDSHPACPSGYYLCI